MRVGKKGLKGGRFLETVILGEGVVCVPTNLLHSIREMATHDARSIAGILPPYEEGRHNPVRKAFFERLVSMHENGSKGPGGLEDSMEAILEAKGPDRFTYAVRLLGFADPLRSHKLYSRLLDKMDEEMRREESYGEYAVMSE